MNTIKIATHDGAILFLKEDGRFSWSNVDGSPVTEKDGTGFVVGYLEKYYGLGVSTKFHWEDWVTNEI